MPRFRPLSAALAWFLLSGLWFKAVPQVNFKVKYVCGKGRYSVRHSTTGPKHYCFDGKYYREKTLPADVRAWFEATFSEVQRAAANEHKFKESRTRREAYRERAEAEFRARRPQGTREGMHGPGLSHATRGAVEASARQKAEPQAAEAVRALAEGATAAEIVAALGEPPGKVATGEGAESWTYLLTTGAFAKLKLEGCRLKTAELP